MTIRHLEIFIAVADTGKMREAAKKLFISQPSVSQAVKELEEHYHVKLFERLNQRIYITDSGKKLLPYARHIVASLEECEEMLNGDREHPVIRIGSSVSVGTALLEKYLQRYETVMPEADVRVTISNTSDVEAMILSSQIDLAIVEGQVESDELNCIKVDTDELFLVVGRKHPFYEKPDITLEMLNGQSLISREAGSADRNQFEQFLKERNIHMVRKWSCSNVQNILYAVMEGKGIGILSNLLIEKELQQGSLRALKLEQIHMKRDLKLIYHKNKYLSDAMRQFIDGYINQSPDNSAAEDDANGTDLIFSK